MNWTCRIIPQTALLVFLLALAGEAYAAGVTRLGGTDLKPDAFAVGAYAMVSYQGPGGGWYDFAGYVTATSVESVSLRQSGFNRRTIPLQQIHSALVGPSRRTVESDAESWRRDNLARQLDLPLDSEAALSYLPTAAIRNAYREAIRNKLPVILLTDPDYLRGRFYGRQQASRDAGSSFRLSAISGAIGGLLASLLWLEGIASDGPFSSSDQSNRFKIAGVGAMTLALPVYTTLASARPDLSEPSPYVLGYRTGFNTGQRQIRMGAALGWLVGTGVGITTTAILVSNTVVR